MLLARRLLLALAASALLAALPAAAAADTVALSVTSRSGSVSAAGVSSATWPQAVALHATIDPDALGLIAGFAPETAQLSFQSFDGAVWTTPADATIAATTQAYLQPAFSNAELTDGVPFVRSVLYRPTRNVSLRAVVTPADSLVSPVASATKSLKLARSGTFGVRRLALPGFRATLALRWSPTEIHLQPSRLCFFAKTRAAAPYRLITKRYERVVRPGLSRTRSTLRTSAARVWFTAVELVRDPRFSDLGPSTHLEQRCRSAWS